MCCVLSSQSPSLPSSSSPSSSGEVLPPANAFPAAEVLPAADALPAEDALPATGAFQSTDANPVQTVTSSYTNVSAKQALISEPSSVASPSATKVDFQRLVTMAKKLEESVGKLTNNVGFQSEANAQRCGIARPTAATWASSNASSIFVDELKLFRSRNSLSSYRYRDFPAYLVRKYAPAAIEESTRWCNGNRSHCRVSPRTCKPPSSI